MYRDLLKIALPSVGVDGGGGGGGVPVNSAKMAIHKGIYSIYNL